MYDYNGILLIDKPYKWSSNFTLKKVKNIFNFNKAGYIGNLDPLATGMLPIIFGKCNNLSKKISDSDKIYNVVAHLGFKTNTYDLGGKITKTSKYKIDLKKISLIPFVFNGILKQKTPKFSNVRYLKKPLYIYALNNIQTIDIPRFVNIYNIEIINYKNNFLELDIFCSSGTYIRSLINDIGIYLKCGAYVYSLRRKKMFNFYEKNMITFSILYKKIYYFNNNYYKILKSLLAFKLINN